MSGAQKNRVMQERSNPASSKGGSNSGSASQTRGSVSPPVGGTFDGNRDPEPLKAMVLPLDGHGKPILPRGLRNMDLGYAAFDMVRGHKIDLARRPAAPSRLGKEILMGLNTFPVNNPKTVVYQYQILVGTGAEKRGLITKVWHSKAVQSKLPVPQSWIFDGNTIAWSMKDMPEMRVQVDLDAEQGKKPRAAGTNIHRVIIKRTAQVDFASLTAYMAGKADFNNKCLEAMTFMDHLLREHPSKTLTSIKRSFFQKGQRRFELGGGIEAFKGIYQSMRIAHSPNGARLSVNVDVANGTFITGGDMGSVVVKMLALRNPGEINLLTDEGSHLNAAIKSKFKELRRLSKKHVYTNHRGEGVRDDYIIDSFIKDTAEKYKIDVRGEDGVTRKVTIVQFFKDKYNVRVCHPGWPVVKMTRRAVLPLEFLRLDDNQRYPYKLDDRQTAAMIKVAVTAPAQRWQDIEHGLGMLKWGEDPFLKNYGMTIDTNRLIVKARLLPAPKLEFGSKVTHEPRTSGRWDLKGRKFFLPNTSPLKSWGVCIVPGRFVPQPGEVDRFMTSFMATYKAHGGKIEAPIPAYTTGHPADLGKSVEELWNATGNKFQLRPQILVFVLNDRDATNYGRIKRSCECRYGVVSQCMQIAHVVKAQPQYMSNVCMKFNAKLGGVTNRAYTPAMIKSHFKFPTMIIGADVSHAAPGTKTASMAAMTVASDSTHTRYIAACEVNGYRTEMISDENIMKLLKPMIQNWVINIGKGIFPKNIIYIRDGVSAGQFSQVIEKEIACIKRMLTDVRPDYGSKYLVMICSKRHQVRFFPKPNDPTSGDRNGNPLPGTLVETGVTHPFENDFYLCAHSAIKGTARPIHYNILLNETEMTNDNIITMIYEHSYQYIRATTPVSLHPAVYYAHLASNRALHHDKNFANRNSAEILKKQEAEEAKAKAKAAEKSKATSSKIGGTAVDKNGNPISTLTPQFEELMVMPDQALISKSMWYI